MQIQNVNNKPLKAQSQPTFKAMHIIHMTPNAVVPKIHPDEIPLLAEDATEYLHDIYTPFSKVAPESVKSIKAPEKSIFALNFTEGFENIEDTFLAFLDEAKKKFPDNLFKHHIVEDVDGGPDLATMVIQKTTKHKEIGFQVPNHDKKI